MSRNYERFFPAHIIFASITAWRGSYEWSKAHGDVVVAPVFAEQNEYEERAREIFRAYQEHPLHGKLFHSISFALANKVPALQTADLLAHELSEYWATIEYQRSPKSAFCIRSSLAKGEEKLDSLPLGGCYDKLSLSNLVRQLREVNNDKIGER
jgi:hypothetical protein